MIINIAGRILSQIETRLHQIFFKHFIPPEPCLASCMDIFPKETIPTEPEKDFGILWAVPKSRRTIEKRRNRKFGWPDHVWKPLMPKVNLIPCSTCGNHHEAGYLCPTCYKRVMDETMEMQESIQEELKLDPVDKEVVVLYQGEQGDPANQFWKGKRIVEMEKERPSWFSKNLLQRTTESAEPVPDVKPKDLA